MCVLPSRMSDPNDMQHELLLSYIHAIFIISTHSMILQQCCSINHLQCAVRRERICTLCCVTLLVLRTISASRRWKQTSFWMDMCLNSTRYMSLFIATSDINYYSFPLNSSTLRKYFVLKDMSQ